MLSSKLKFESKWLGLIDYQEGLRLQQNHWLECQKNNRFTLLGLMHPLVITLGKRGDRKVDIINSDPDLNVVQTDRGGQATLHNPGQVVIYPILNLESLGMGIKDYVMTVLKVTQETLADLGLSTQVGEESGLYTDKGKVAFVGIRVDQGISRHGLSVNLCNDLTQFQWIRSCGQSQAKVDSVAQYNIQVTPHEFFEKWTQKWVEKVLHLC